MEWTNMQYLHDDSPVRDKSFNLRWRAVVLAVLAVALSVPVSIALAEFIETALLT